MSGSGGATCPAKQSKKKLKGDPSLDEKSRENLAEIMQLGESDLPQKEKISLILEKFTEQLKKQQEAERENQKAMAKENQVISEKDTYQSDISANQLARSKIESVCRELQKENKRIKEECEKIVQEEHQKREELTEKLNFALSEMETKFDFGDEYKEVVSNYEKMSQHLSLLQTQYESRDLQLKGIFQEKESKIAKLGSTIEAQIQAAGDENIRAELLEKEIKIKQEGEEKLQKQLDVYAHKFETVQLAISQSNASFSFYKKEMDEIVKKLKKSEKENEKLASKCETLNSNLYTILQQRSAMLKEFETFNGQRGKMESLCLALEKERKENSLVLKKFREAFPDSPVFDEQRAKFLESLEKEKEKS